MKFYNVSLSRAYVVTIEAENKEKARQFTEYYIGHCFNSSKIEDQIANKFLIVEIEPTINEAIDVKELKENNK